MKNNNRFIKSLVACGIALAMTATVFAQTPVSGKATVIRIKGSARFSTGNNVWQPLKTGQKLKPGTIIQTAANSTVDLALGDGKATDLSAVEMSSSSPPSDAMYYQPSAAQNTVRMWENTLMVVDKLTSMDTGADMVTETQLDLKAGRIMGSVKKMSAASKYEVKVPNGVAGIRGTIYDITADGVVRVSSGSVVLAYVGADGNVVTQVVTGGQQFDPRTGQITPISAIDLKVIDEFAKASHIAPLVAPRALTADHTIYFVSPTQGDASAANSSSGNGGGERR